MNKRKLIAGALSASLMVSVLPGLALGQDEPADSLSPEGVEWTLSTLAGEAVPEGVQTTLFLSGGEVVGNAGCNSYFGSYELDGDALTFPNPFGVTLKLCEEPAMAVEGAYLPLLQDTATWSIDEEGALSLADAEGTVQLVYGEAPVDVTQTDVDALVSTLENLQAQIDQASAEVAALAEEAASVDVDKFDKRLTNAEKSINQLENRTEGLNVANLKKRISANEKAIADLQKQVNNVIKNLEQLKKTDENLKKRIKTLETTDKDHENRISALEEAVFQAAPLPE